MLPLTAVPVMVPFTTGFFIVVLVVVGSIMVAVVAVVVDVVVVVAVAVVLVVLGSMMGINGRTVPPLGWNEEEV